MAAPRIPTFHKPIPMGTRVIVPEHLFGDGKDHLGTVIGIASLQVFFIYIVLLDEPWEDPNYGTCQAVPVSGCALRGQDGTDYQVD